MKSEAKIKLDIVKYLQLRGFLCWKLSDRFRSGIPDIFCARDGKVYFFEIKKESGVVSKLQEYTIKQLNDHGICAGVVRSVEDVKKLIENKQEEK